MTFARILILIIHVNFVVFETDAIESYNADEFVGKWYVLAAIHPYKAVKMFCMQKHVTKDENNIFTIVTNGVCPKYCEPETVTATIIDSIIYEIPSENNPNPANISISRYNQDDEIILYDIRQQNYFLMSRINKMSRKFFEMCVDLSRQYWAVNPISHRGCE